MLAEGNRDENNQLFLVGPRGLGWDGEFELGSEGWVGTQFGIPDRRKSLYKYMVTAWNSQYVQENS